ncbi:hypothetical protein BC831DRAFT_450198 [Entophlyctis helioformis]|nr:hypothetical protein BC831DRAFT_450198 [Entophlyctis helioformis]
MDEDLLADLDELDGFDDTDPAAATAGAGSYAGSYAGTHSKHASGTARKRSSSEANGDNDNGNGDDNDDDDLELDSMDDGDGDGDDEEMTAAAQAAHAALMSSVANADDVRSVLRVFGSRQLRDVLQRINVCMQKERLPEHNTGPVEEDPEYQVIVQSNNLTVDLDNEILLVHKFIRDHYAPRFPELESLVLNPMDYARTVKMVGNEEDLTKVDLKSFLPSATVMVVMVTATTTNGVPLTEEKLGRVVAACDVALELDAAKRSIIEYVQSRMGFIAPNLTSILGSGVAAKVMSHAGGLTALSKIPACNIMVLGAQKKTNTGMSSLWMGRHAGFVYQCDLVLQTPEDLRRKAARLVAAKCALAARIDCARECVDGSAGRKYRQEIEKKIEVLVQPPPGKRTKALPVPDEGRRQRRGGKRVRKAKERVAHTELSKAQNRMAFGEAEEEIGFGEDTVGLGMIGKTPGRVRGIQADTRVKVSVSKRHKSFSAQSSNTSGLSSSVAFTPVKGIELENPEVAAQRAKDAAAAKDSRYFSGGFFKMPAKKA